MKLARLRTRLPAGSIAGGWVACVVLAASVVWSVSRSYPALPAALTVQVDFLAGRQPRPIEPLIAAGTAAETDLLLVRYLGETTAAFVYIHAGREEAESDAVGFTPGRRHRLEVAMPTFTALRGSPPVSKRLRVAFDGRPLLDREVPSTARAPDALYFGQNPLGGPTAGTSFRGEIFTADGRPLRGEPAVYFPWSRRLRTWLMHARREALFALLAAVAAGWATACLGRRAARTAPQSAEPPPPACSRAAAHGAFAASALLCVAAFAHTITGGTWRLDFAEHFGDFYDHQAQSLLHGHWDVPPTALNDEAFAVEGKSYGYFGPTPAILRLPFALAGLGFGRWSRAYMVGYYFLALLAAYALLREAGRWRSGGPREPRPAEVALFTLATGLGSTLFFLGSRAYVFHEAILGGAMAALWSSYCSLRYLATPRHRWWLGALLAGVLAVHARPPAGLFALALLGSAALAVLVRRAREPASGPARWLPPLGVGVLATLGILSFNAVSYLKFRSFDGAPLGYHVQYHPGRLAVIQGRNFHLENIRYNFDAYTWRQPPQLRPTFPYLFMARPNPHLYAGTRVDVAEPIVSLPLAMPGSILLAGLGALAAFATWPESRLPLGLISLALLPMAAALMAAIALSHRYTGDFCPAMIAAAAFGLAGLGTFRPPWRRPLYAVVTLFTLSSLLITPALTLQYQGEVVHGVPAEVRARFQSTRQHVDRLLGFQP